MYVWLRRIHLWFTFASVVVLVNLSLSGSALVFAKEIQQFMQADLWQVQPQAGSLAVPTLVEEAERQSQSTVTTLYIEQEPHIAWQAQLADDTYVNLDPYSGELLHRYRYDGTLYGFLLAWHRTLLAPEALSAFAKDLVSVTTLIFCINALLGLWLWLKPKKRWQRLQFRRTRSRKAQLYQLHSIFGVYCVMPLLLIAFTGMAFHWITPTQAVVQGLTGQVIAQPVHPKANFEGKTDLALALERAQAVLPAGAVKRIYFPKKAGDTLRLRVQMPGESHPYSWVWLEPATAEVIDFFDASQQNLATQAWHFRYKFHIGAWWNGAVQGLWLLLALMPSLWAVTGLWMYLKRRNVGIKRHPRKLSTPASAAQEVYPARDTV